jgi:hypothetical protein
MAFLAFNTISANTGEKIWKFKEEKKINKNFNVTADALLSVTNKYGSIFLTTWDGSSISIEVLITVSSNNEKWVKERINQIDVSFSNSMSEVKATTEIESSNSWNSNNNNSIEIRYTVKIPKGNKVLLNQKYGEIKTHAIAGNANITCKYGKVDLESLNGENNSVLIEYCNNSNIGFIKTGSVKAKYSKLNVKQFDNISLYADYTDVDFGSGNTIKAALDYVKLSFMNVKNLEGNGDYMKLKIQSLEGNLNFVTKYSSLDVLKINTKSNQINVDASYTNVNLYYAINHAFDFDIALKYGDFKYENTLEISNSEKSHFENKFKGHYLKRNVNSIKVVNKYGNVTLKSI